MPISLEVGKADVDRYLKARERKRQASSKKLSLYYSDPVAFIHDCVDFGEEEGLTFYQEEVMSALVEHKRVAQRGPHGLGKDLCISTPVPTPTGWTTMGQLQVGDEVFNEDGIPVVVTYAEDAQWREAYEVMFSDGSTIVAGAGHLWTAVDIYHRPRTKRIEGKRRTLPVEDWRNHWDVARTQETREMAGSLRTPAGQLRWRVPTSRPLNLPNADLPIDPYLLGAWLGDGTSAAGAMTCGEPEVGHFEAEWNQRGWSTRIRRYPNRAPTLGIYGLAPRLRDIGVLGNKHIPTAYLRASEPQRRALVQGIMDTDGFRMEGNLDGIDLCDKQLAADVIELLHSLGLSVRMREEDAVLDGRITGRRWRINARFDECPFRLPRKREGWMARGNQGSRHTQRTITAITPLGQRLTRCIAVDSPRHLFLAGEAMVPTHNTTTAALLVLWFALTRDGAGADWKCPTTAGAWRQLEDYLWPEIWKWAKVLRWDRIGREPFKRHELLRLNLNLDYGSARALASNVPAYIEGAHADQMLYIFDESKAIIDATFDAAEGAFSGAGVDGREAFALASSTPGAPAGRFYNIHMHKDGFEDWWTKHVTLEDAIKARRIKREWANQRKLQFGEDSQMYYNRVLGEFHADETDTIIPLSWIEAAQTRWGNNKDAIYDRIDRVGVDVARSGNDETVIATVTGQRVHPLKRTFHEDIPKTADERVSPLLEVNPEAVCNIDADGLGAGVFDLVAKAYGKSRVRPFHASAATDWKDDSGELEFLNTRAAAWWNLRQLLDPHKGSTIELPDDERLTADLCAPRKKESARGKIQVESKEEVKKRIEGRSTDSADAVIHAFWENRRRRRRRMGNMGFGEEKLTGEEALVS